MSGPDDPPTGNRSGGSKQRDTPFGAGLPLGRWAGVPVRAHWSVAAAFLLFAGLLATSYLPVARPGHAPALYWVTGAVTALVFLTTLLVHELAHAVTARHFRMPVKSITLWMLGGLTELGGEPPTPRADALVAASGPLASLALGGGFAVAALLVGGPGLVATSLAWLAVVSVLLGVFNLLPGAPLDGGRLVRALLWWRSGDRAMAAERAARSGRVVGIVLVGLGLLEVLLGYLTGAWLALVGWFIMSGAASERYAVRGERLHGLLVRDVMTATPVVAPDWRTVEEFLTSLDPRQATQPVFPLVDIEGRLSGTLSLSALERVPVSRRAESRLRDVARSRPALLETSPETDLAGLWLSIHLRGGTAVVVEGGRPVGVVTEAELARAARFVDLGGTGR